MTANLRYVMFDQPLLNRSCQEAVEQVQAANSLVDSHMRRVVPRGPPFYMEKDTAIILDKRIELYCGHQMCWCEPPTIMVDSKYPTYVGGTFLSQTLSLQLRCLGFARNLLNPKGDVSIHRGPVGSNLSGCFCQSDHTSYYM